MTKRQAENLRHLTNRLIALGFDGGDIDALMRIEKTLGNWAVKECGDENGGTIERDEETGKPFFTYERGDGKRGRYSIPDREAGALRRLAALMSHHPRLWAYHQGDPRGCALYVGKKSDLRQYKERGIGVDCVYNSIGVAVCI